MKTKGQSNLLGWVLLIGFAVTLSVIVGGYIKNMASTSIEGVVENTENELACRDVSILAVEKDDNHHICDTSTGLITNLWIKNKGRRNIDKIRLQGCSTENRNNRDIDLKVNGLEKEINLNTCTTITIIPFIEGNVGCSDKKITIEC